MKIYMRFIYVYHICHIFQGCKCMITPTVSAGVEADSGIIINHMYVIYNRMANMLQFENYLNINYKLSTHGHMLEDTF